MPARRLPEIPGNEMTGHVQVDLGATGTALQETLIELTDLHLRAKQAHWNVAGAHFVPVHKQLDKLTDAARDAADLVAERAVAIGYAVDARPATVTKSTPLPDFPAGQVRDAEVVDLISETLAEICLHVRHRVDRLGQTDVVSQDLLTGVLAELEKHRWMFTVQRVGA